MTKDANMKRIVIAIAALAAMVASANAKTYEYACHVEGDYKLYVFKMDDSRKTMTWHGTTYRNLRDTSLEQQCGKACYTADSKDSTATLNTATQGGADLTVGYGGVGQDGIEQMQCDALRRD